ncbi:MAG: HAD-IB family hydrolase [Thiocapsa sp.]|nr:HAD family hydrolase [Thiocapsa sp.]MCG6896630.1 HAD-IB family hydrolase [Thiocapsa sp.]MCG6985998.1 HAD-IB family hydrolase [Thiocapsa sp.]
MALAIFDLDNTLLAGDSDYLWGRFLAAEGIVDRAEYERENERFYREYKAGTLDIREFLRFSLRPLRDNARERLEALRERFVAEQIEPIILPAAKELVERHREAGDILLIITATNEFVTAPIAARFGVAHLIATQPAEEGGHFTGEPEGPPAFREGKVRRLEAWLEQQQTDLAGSCFYSDSHNDLPLLERVDRPIAVDPDPRLREAAVERGWSIISLRC